MTNDPVTSVIVMNELEKSPRLNHDGLKFLFITPALFYAEELQFIFGLPRKTLIEDLKTMVTYGLQNQADFEAEDGLIRNRNFVMHALFLLALCKDKDTRGFVFDFLRKDEDTLEFWLSDSLTDCGDGFIADAAHDDVDALTSLLFEEELAVTVRMSAAQAAGRMFYEGRMDRDRLLGIYRKYYAWILKENPGKEDDQVSAFMADIADLHLTELEDIVKDAFQKGLVDFFLFESEENYFEELHSTEEPFLPDHSLLARYQYLGYRRPEMEEFDEDDFTDFEDEEDDNWIVPAQKPFVKQSPAIGRNDLCPCGSGKKYKKCHGMAN